MSYLLHGSTTHTGMGWVDRIPRAGSLYIGGLYALYQTDLIRSAGITHVLSVIDYDPKLHSRFPDLKLQHLHIQAEDSPSVDLLREFERVVGWMDGALGGQGKEGGGGVFVHCAMGKSRSATLVVAYLMWQYNLDATAALQQVCEGRPVCDPNPGFKEQLEVWGRMLKCGDKERRIRVYEEWDKGRFRGESWEWEQQKSRL